jgi:hypothetical protein
MQVVQCSLFQVFEHSLSCYINEIKLKKFTNGIYVDSRVARSQSMNFSHWLFQWNKWSHHHTCVKVIFLMVCPRRHYEKYVCHSSNFTIIGLVFKEKTYKHTATQPDDTQPPTSTITCSHFKIMYIWKCLNYFISKLVLVISIICYILYKCVPFLLICVSGPLKYIMDIDDISMLRPLNPHHWLILFPKASTSEEEHWCNVFSKRWHLCIELN